MGGSDRDQAVEPHGDMFPWLVTLGCLIVALALFAHSTMPALAERYALQDVQEQKNEQLQDTATEARELRERAGNLSRDPERVLRELDGHGISARDVEVIEESTDSR